MPTRRRDPLARDLPAELQVAATNGSILTDSRGRKYIDFVMGWCVANFGWRPAPIARAIESFEGPDYVYPGYSYAPWTELARLIEPISINLGVLIPDHDVIRRVRDLCRRYGTLFIGSPAALGRMAGRNRPTSRCSLLKGGHSRRLQGLEAPALIFLRALHP